MSESQGFDTAGAKPVSVETITVRSSGSGPIHEQPAVGGFSYEPRTVKRRTGKRATGPVCPDEDCGGILSRTRIRGRDENEVYVRERECLDCGLVYVTAEKPVFVEYRDKKVRLAKFREIDMVRFEKNRRNARRRRGSVQHRKIVHVAYPVYGTMTIKPGAKAARALQEGPTE